MRALCTKHGILMVCDEVMAGFGRTGEWFAVNHWNVVPDIITLAKGLTSAYVAMGAVGVRQPIADHFRDKVFQGGLTYNSHPLGCAAALATLRVYEEDDLIGNARRLGPVLTAAADGAGAEAPVYRRAPLDRIVRPRGARQGPGDEGTVGGFRSDVARDQTADDAVAGGRAVYVRPLAHVLHEPPALGHRRRNCRRDSR